VAQIVKDCEGGDAVLQDVSKVVLEQSGPLEELLLQDVQRGVVHQAGSVDEVAALASTLLAPKAGGGGESGGDDGMDGGAGMLPHDPTQETDDSGAPLNRTSPPGSSASAGSGADPTTDMAASSAAGSSSSRPSSASAGVAIHMASFAPDSSSSAGSGASGASDASAGDVTSPSAGTHASSQTPSNHFYGGVPLPLNQLDPRQAQPSYSNVPPVKHMPVHAPGQSVPEAVAAVFSKVGNDSDVDMTSSV
jgi:hypothetical protein